MDTKTKNIFLKILTTILVIIAISMSVVYVVSSNNKQVDAAPSKGDPSYTYLKINIENAGYVEVYTYIGLYKTITSFPTLLACNSTVGDSIDYFVAIPNEGYQFVKWTYSSSSTQSSTPQNNPETNTSYDQNATFGSRSDVTVYFEKSAYQVTVASADTNKGTVSGGGEVNVGNSTTITATPKSGYIFKNWTDGNGNVVSTSASYTFTPNANISLTANFLAQYVVSVASADTNKGTVSGGGTVTEGNSITVTASPKSGYVFKNWTNSSGTAVSTNASYTFTPTANTTLTANFVAQYTVSVASANTNKGTVSGGGTVTEGNNITVTATPKSGYVFKNWTNSSGSAVSTNASYTFTPTANISLTANFLAQYVVSVVSSDNNRGTVSGGGTVIEGNSITVTATPKSGFMLVSWTDSSDAVVATSESYTFTPTANTTLTANFVVQYVVSVVSADTNRGTVSGGAGIPAGDSITVTATPKVGYTFKNWTDSTGAVVYIYASYTFTPTANITLTANFGEYILIHNGSSYITTFTYGYDATNAQLTLTITPNTGQYISEISFDNNVYQTLDCWTADFCIPCNYALGAKYNINTTSNLVGLVFSHCAFNTGIDIYVKTVSTPYTALKKPNNPVEQIAVTATKGGTVILIGDDYDNLNDDDTITCIAKTTLANYEFVGWVFASDIDTVISTDESVKFAKKDIYERQLIAKFIYVESYNVNYTLDNSSI